MMRELPNLPVKDNNLPEQQNLQRLPAQQSACPSCGYCPHCGRGRHIAAPWATPYYPSPQPQTIPYPQITWGETPGAIGGGVGLSDYNTPNLKEYLMTNVQKMDSVIRTTDGGFED